jgi:hypothetical protein
MKVANTLSITAVLSLCVSFGTLSPVQADSNDRIPHGWTLWSSQGQASFLKPDRFPQSYNARAQWKSPTKRGHDTIQEPESFRYQSRGNSESNGCPCD